MLKACSATTNRNTKDVGINGCDCFVASLLAMTNSLCVVRSNNRWSLVIKFCGFW